MMDQAVASRPAPLLWRFGPVTLDEAALVLSVGGVPARLERRPLELLLLLLRHAGEVVTKDEMLDALWPDRIVTEASLTKCMARLRQALGEAQAQIRTVHGYGYRLEGEVTVAATSHGPALPATLDLAAGQAVPHRPEWRLLQRLGTGGFGDVWLAELPGTGQRRVFKFAADGPRLAALRREIAVFRLLGAGLGPRDDLARVLDWELGEPPCFLATEWEEGNLAQWLDALGGAFAVPLELRLALLAEIAEALAAAHGMGVLHRDLKPANVLIWRDAAGAPHIRLADFGSGRVLDAGRLDALGITRPEAAATGGTSTEPYRAPELLAGRTPTVQADIYALGILLYQLAIGDLTAPLAPGWERGVPDPLLREDIAEAANGDPARRLGEAALLAQRLRQLPERRAARAEAEREAAEEARLRAALDRAAARRGPVLALVAVLALGFGVSSWLGWRAVIARGEARREAARAEAVTRFLTHDLLSAANPFLADNPNVTVKEVLAAAARGLDRRFPAHTLDRADIEQVIGKAYAGIGDAEALPLLRSALATRSAALGPADARTQQLRLDIADFHDRVEDGQAIAAAREVLAIGRQAGQLSAEDELRARVLVATNMCNANPTEAACLTPLRALFEEARAKLGPASDITLTVEANLAFNLSQAEQFPEAIRLAREALALTQASAGPDNLMVQDARYALAQVLMEAGQTQEAVALLSDVRRKLLTVAGHENTATIRAANQLGKAYYEAGNYPAALPLLRLTRDFSVRTRGPTNILSRAALNNVANTLAHMGRAREALPMQLQALALQRAVDGPDNAQTLWCENGLGKIQRQAGDLAGAEATYADLLARASRVFAHGEWDLGEFQYGAGLVLADAGKREAARAMLGQSVQGLTRALGADHARTKEAVAALAALDRAAAAGGTGR